MWLQVACDMPLAPNEMWMNATAARTRLHLRGLVIKIEGSSFPDRVVIRSSLAIVTHTRPGEEAQSR